MRVRGLDGRRRRSWQGPARELIVDTARYWASRVRVDRDGRGHLFGVMGPDEYHEVVDDNAYTNVMARWNLRRAAAARRRRRGGDAAEAVEWRRLAARWSTGGTRRAGCYEQFAGYWGLEPLLIADVGRAARRRRRPVGRVTASPARS